MITVASIYEDVARDSVNKDENGYLDYQMFNRMSRRAELRLLDWLTGDVSGQKLPIAYSTQKVKDWLAPLITSFSTMLDADGKFAKPADYYYYDNSYSLYKNDIICDDAEHPRCEDEEVVDEILHGVADMLNGDRFNQRKNSYIKGLKPSAKRPILKEVGNYFYVEPKQLGGFVLEYVAIPVFASIVTMNDPVYNQPVINPATSVNYVWPEGVREALIYFITDSFANHTREEAMKQFNAVSNQSAVGK